MEDPNASGDVITEEVASGDVIDQQAQGQTTDGVTVEEAQKPQETVQEEKSQSQQFRDDYWKNRAMELERKSQNLAQELPQIIERSLQQHQQKAQQPKYTVDQLLEFKESTENPAERAWAEKEIRRLERDEADSRIKKLLEERETAARNDQIKAQATQQVLSDPLYADAFVSVNGQKSWNPNSELAQRMGGYLQDPRVSNQPDAMLIAAKLAKADMILASTPAKVSELTQAKRQTEKLKQQTLVEGGGTNHQPTVKDEFTLAQQRLVESGGSKKAAEDAVAAYFKKHRS